MTQNKKTKMIGTRVSPDAEKFLIDNYNTAAAGLSACVEAFKHISEEASTTDYTEISQQLETLQQIRSYAQRELKDKFTASEWKYLIDCLNGTTIPPQLRCSQSVLVASVEDANSFDNTASKWDVEMDPFISNINTLTGAQVDAVYTGVETFWKRSAEEQIDLAGWVESLI